MPNLPLQLFRAVEPAHFGFAAGATLASQPFVLYHERSTVTIGSGEVVPSTAISFSGSLSADRFNPWVWRNNDACYPVKIPNAYDRIHVFPMYVLSASSGSPGSFALPGTYAAPWIMPFGLAPQTRDFTATNKLHPNVSRLPDDIIAAMNLVASFNSRTNGIWNVLAPYASNFSTSNGILAVGSSANPTSFGRATTGTGTGYALPDDLSVATAGTGFLAENNARWATGSPVLIGMGHDFQTMGAEELVVAPGSSPSGINANYAQTIGVSYSCHYFLMGTFLG